jgi:hypothetical protein
MDFCRVNAVGPSAKMLGATFFERRSAEWIPIRRAEAVSNVESSILARAGDRARTGDVQLGKLSDARAFSA